ncbi:MAG TPA: hypothetical protein VN643_27385 [Pyrinomonadaceae bacterium]|nr:hypothetical protein [Pyrinomonadaceae bacterium]
MEVKPLSLVNDSLASNALVIAVIEGSSSIETRRSIPEPALPIRKVLRLDVDEVLRRSLPKLGTGSTGDLR